MKHQTNRNLITNSIANLKLKGRAEIICSIQRRGVDVEPLLRNKFSHGYGLILIVILSNSYGYNQPDKADL